jgi:antitoxin component YwqK of YwqJK toxin-antitoxin module
LNQFWFFDTSKNFTRLSNTSKAAVLKHPPSTFVKLDRFVVGFTVMTKEILIAQLVERGGISYEVNSTTPFAGVTLDYDENGQLQQRSNYKDGKSEGFSEKYYNNGQLEWRANFKDGKLDGLWEKFYENGQLEEKRNYKNGKIDGIYDVFYENGQLEWRANYKDGKLDGLFELFDENGNLTKTKEYKNGELIKGVKNGKRTI